jgi:crotonobetainyl-CoA hydratase
MMPPGAPVSAARALELGLVNRVVPRAQVLAAALELAEAICQNAPLSVRVSKRIARAMIDSQVPAEDGSWERTSAEMAALRQSADAAEGRRAFAEKRPPNWLGR